MNGKEMALDYLERSVPSYENSLLPDVIRTLRTWPEYKLAMETPHVTCRERVCASGAG